MTKISKGWTETRERSDNIRGKVDNARTNMSKNTTGEINGTRAVWYLAVGQHVDDLQGRTRDGIVWRTHALEDSGDVTQARDLRIIMISMIIVVVVITLAIAIVVIIINIVIAIFIIIIIIMTTLIITIIITITIIMTTIHHRCRRHHHRHHHHRRHHHHHPQTSPDRPEVAAQ